MYIPTRENLQKALLELLEERSLDDITVKMVCQRAGVSRQALYNHYYCLLDVFQDLLFRELEEAIAGCDTYLTWDSGYRAVWESLQTRRTAVLRVFRSSYGEDFLRMLDKFGRGLVGQGIEQCAADLRLSAPEQDKEFMVNLYMYAFMGVIRRWLEEGMRLAPEYIATRCEAVMRRSIRDTLKRLEQMDAAQLVDNRVSV